MIYFDVKIWVIFIITALYSLQIESFPVVVTASVILGYLNAQIPSNYST